MVFPIYIFTNKYNQIETLSQEEQQLYHAEIHFLEGKYEQAYQEFCTIRQKAKKESVMLGAITMQAIAGMYIGDPQVLLTNYEQMASFKAEKGKENKKELDLLLDAFRVNAYHLKDISPWLKDADYKNLDPEVFPLACEMLLLIKRFEMIKGQVKPDLSMMECIASAIEKEGILPITIYTHLGIACAYLQQGDRESATEHVVYVIDDILDKKWYGIILETYTLLGYCYDQILPQKDAEVYYKIKEEFEQFIPVWYKSYEYINQETKIKNLSRKEIQIALDVANGCSNNEIAENNGFSINTIKRYLNIIYQKLDVKNRSELTEMVREYII